MKIFKIHCLLALVLLVGCSDDNGDGFNSRNCLNGQGTRVQQSRSLNSFHSINNTVVADVLLTQGPQEDIVIEGQPNIIAILETEVVNNELILSFNRCVENIEELEISITIPEIRKLTLTGVGNFIAQNSFDLAELEVALTGVGNFDLRGSSNVFDIDLNGVGNINTFDLITEDCNINIVGASIAEVFVQEELNVNIVGSGIVFYKGNPTINSTINGTGTVVDSN